MSHAFDARSRDAVYRAIFTRRDVRAQFSDAPVDDAVLARLITAAHHAPSVGYMQPWSFIVVRSVEIRRQVHVLFERANAEAAARFDDERRRQYLQLKLQGILDAPLNLCITCDPDRAGEVVLGRTHDPATDRYSTACAVQNLWLAARAEGIGVGWVSILDLVALRRILGIPPSVIPVAYLCLGHVSAFLDRPELERAGWRERLPLETLVHGERWEGAADPALIAELRDA